MKYFAIFLSALFAAAKLYGAISWSWWLVFTPILIYCGFYALVFIIVCVIAVLADLLEDS